MIFLDANLILRALTQPDDERSRRYQTVASTLLRQAARGEVHVTTSDAVLAEVAFILTAKKHYGLPPIIAAGLLGTIVRLRGFRHPRKKVLVKSLGIWESNPVIGFVDALTAAYAQSTGMVLATFDSDFNTLSGIERWDPDAMTEP